MGDFSCVCPRSKRWKFLPTRSYKKHSSSLSYFEYRSGLFFFGCRYQLHLCWELFLVVRLFAAVALRQVKLVAICHPRWSPASWMKGIQRGTQTETRPFNMSPETCPKIQDKDAFSKPHLGHTQEIYGHQDFLNVLTWNTIYS